MLLFSRGTDKVKCNVLSSKDRLMENVNLQGRLGSQDHKMVEFKILRAVRKVFWTSGE